MEVLISKSNRKDKRLKAMFENKTIHFGYDKGKTFVDHNDKELKNAWLARHKVNSDFDNIETAGSLAKNILELGIVPWNKALIHLSKRECLSHEGRSTSSTQ